MDKSNIIQRETQRAAEKIQYEDNFIVRNYWLWVAVAFVLYPLATVLSGLTEGGHVLIRLKSTMGDTGVAWVITFLIVFLIELPKFILGKGAIDDIQAGVFSEGGAKLSIFIIKVLGFIAVMVFSVTLSIKGGPVLNEAFRKQYKPVEAEYISIEEINDRYDAEALPYQEKIANFSKTTWKGKIVGDARKMIMKEQDFIAGIEARRNSELAAAVEENTKRRADYDEKTEINGSWAMGFAGLGEGICIFCLIFIGIYDDGIKAQAKSTPSQRPLPSQPDQMAFILEEIKKLQNNQGNNVFKQIANQSHPIDNERRPIGFHKDNQMKASQGRESNTAPLSWEAEEEEKAFNTVQQVLNTKNGGVKVIDARYFKGWMKQSYKRSLSYKTEKARYYNKCLYLRLRNELEEIGWKITEMPNTDELEIIEA